MSAVVEDGVGERLHDFMTELFPLPRSITGDGVRATLRAVGERIPLQLREVASGTEVFDWSVPPEWNVRAAWVTGPDGRRVVDLADSTLHLVSYSVPVRATMTLAELRPHLHALPDQPDLVPYRTSYYRPDWGFCLTRRALDALPEGSYEVVVDSTLAPGSLTYGECVLPGEEPDEVVVSTHVCHPALASDNLSGIAIATETAARLLDRPHRWTYRFVFAPGTIGALTWLHEHPDVLPRIRHGVVLTGLGGPGPLVWKRTRHGARAVDRAAAAVLRGRPGTELRDFSPWGYDERQYGAPGFDLPFGRLSRTPHGEFPEYHTSGDDLAFVTPASLTGALAAVTELLEVLEHDATYRNLSPYGEPQLGKRGLYPSVGGRSADDAVLAMLWVLNLSDGSHSLLDVAERSGMAFGLLRRAAEDLTAAGLLAPEPVGA